AQTPVSAPKAVVRGSVFATAPAAFAAGEALRGEEGFTDSDKAISHYSRAIELDATFAPAFVRRAEVHFSRAEYRDAVADFDRAVALLPTDATLITLRGIAYLRMGDARRAIQDCDEALRLRPDFLPAYGNRGNAW